MRCLVGEITCIDLSSDFSSVVPMLLFRVNISWLKIKVLQADDSSFLAFPSELPFFGFPSELIFFGFPSEIQVFGFPSEIQVIGFPSEIQVFGFPSEIPVLVFPLEISVFGFPSEILFLRFTSEFLLISFPFELPKPYWSPVLQISLWSSCPGVPFISKSFESLIPTLVLLIPLSTEELISEPSKQSIALSSE